MESDNEWGDFHKFLVDNIWKTNPCKELYVSQQVILNVSKNEANILIGYLELADIPELQEVVSRLKNTLKREELYSNTSELKYMDPFQTFYK